MEFGERFDVVAVRQPDAVVLGEAADGISIVVFVAAVGKAVQEEVLVLRMETVAEDDFVEGF